MIIFAIIAVLAASFAALISLSAALHACWWAWINGQLDDDAITDFGSAVVWALIAAVLASVSS